MARYQVILAYDGSNYNGFQRQVRGKSNRTIQGEVESALRQIGWQDRTILAAGRTDAGVHASGQVIAFDFAWRHSDDELRAALNANLPPDIAAQQVFQTGAEFHPRFDATARRYRYRIFCGSVRDPLRERYAWRVWPPVDFERLQAAAAQLPGTHDFGAFGSPPQPGGVTLRQVLWADWMVEADGITFEIVANAFLYRMARRLTAFQVKISQGLRSVEAIQDCLEAGSKKKVRELAPPQGLNLVEVIYSDPEENNAAGCPMVN